MALTFLCKKECVELIMQKKTRKNRKENEISLSDDRMVDYISILIKFEDDVPGIESYKLNGFDF